MPSLYINWCRHTTDNDDEDNENGRQNSEITDRPKFLSFKPKLLIYKNIQ